MYTERKKIGFDNTLRLSSEVLSVSGLQTGDYVKVMTESGSGCVVLEKEKEGKKK